MTWEYFLEALTVDAGPPHTFITIGKGGVGKTTVSILAARALSGRGRVLLASLDPAKHLLEYLGLPGPLRKSSVAENLDAIQYDIGPLAKKLADEYAVLLRQVMPGLVILNLDDVVKSVRHAPGFEEEVFLRILEELYSLEDEYDYVVIDTPPTGVTHRILNLPRLYVFWLERLHELRSRIVSLRYAMARAMGRREKPRDPVLDKLEELHGKYSRLWGKLRDPSRTSVTIIATPEPLPVYEARTTIELLESLGVRCRMIVANRILPWDKAVELGVSEVQRRSLEDLARLARGRCRLLGILQARKAPRSLGDVEELEDIVVRVEDVLAEAPSASGP